MTIEDREDERRYKEAGASLAAEILNDPVTVLKPKPAVVVAPGDRVADVVARMADARSGCAVVMDGTRLAGVFTERDALTRVLSAGLDASATKVADVMTPDPDTLHVNDTLGFALHKMSVGQFRNLPLIDDDGQPLGMVTQQDGVRYLVGFFPEGAINQPPQSIEQHPPRNQYGG